MPSPSRTFDVAIVGAGICGLAHALAAARRYAAEHPAAKILIGLSGRGDKDMPTLSRTLLAPAPEPGAAATTATVAIGKFK